MTKDPKRLLGRLLVLAAMVFTSAAYRLPTSVRPQHYKLRIDTTFEPHNDNFTFAGDVTIKVKALEPTTSITLHAKELSISHEHVQVLSAGGDQENLKEGHRLEPEDEFYVIELKRELKPNVEYDIHIPFRANLTEGLAGYYRSSYKDRGTNETRWLAVTQFEPTDARRAFPCFDEPAMKARFTVSLGRQKRYSSISNMPLTKTEPMEGHPEWFVDHFQTSKIMSTYLVAFMVSEFKYRESQSGHGNRSVTFRTWARPDAYDQTEYAAEIGPKIVRYFEKYFDTEYPLPKMDMVAIPDFSPGAMENWGLITYRETAMLYDPKVTSVGRKQGVASTISHELAHQWFGNLVTMKWWTDLWLNEGFATYVSTLGVNEVHPEWKVIDEEAMENRLELFQFDSLNSSHPVSVPIGNPREIEQIFDIISYQKGSFLIRMMTHFLGEKVFREGVSQYLHKHRYGNAEQDDLWGCLTKEGHSAGVLPENMTVKEIMDTWTLQTGYPLVTVTRDYETGWGNVSQSRYLTYNVRKRTDKDQSRKSVWLVPLSYTGQVHHNFNDTASKVWLKERSVRVDLNDEAEHQGWVIFNIQLGGMYRVQYDERNWKLLADTLNSDHYQDIGVLNRILLLDDALQLAWTGELDYDVAMRLPDYLVREREYLPWQAGLSNLGDLEGMVDRTLAYGDYRRYMSKLLEKVYGSMTNLTAIPEGDHVMAIAHHVRVSAWACKLEMGSCVQQARDLYSHWMQEPDHDAINPIPRDLRSLVYCTAIKFGGEREWNFAWRQYLRSNVGSEQSTMLWALGCSRDTWLLERYLDWSVDKTSGIRAQDSSGVFSSVARRTTGFLHALNFFQERIADIHAYYGPKASRLSRYIRTLADQMIHEKEYQSFKAFVDTNSHLLKDCGLAVKQALEGIQINVQWHAKNYDKFHSIIKQKYL